MTDTINWTIPGLTPEQQDRLDAIQQLTNKQMMEAEYRRQSDITVITYDHNRQLAEMHKEKMLLVAENTELRAKLNKAQERDCK